MVLFGETMAMKADTPLTLTTTDDEDMMVEAAVDMDAFSAFTDVTDSQLAEAALNAVTSGKLTPLIKVELRSTIQAKRLSEGKEELEVEIESAIEDDLTQEEIEKRHRRRERNKVAAQKCRQKRKIRADGLHEESIKLENSNQELRVLIQSLEKERETLREMITSHEPLCVLKNDQ